MYKSIYKKYKNFYFAQQFNPSYFWGMLLNPFYFARKGLFQTTSILAPFLKGDVLDVGCGSKPYQKLFVNAKSYVGLEYDTPANRRSKNAEYFYDGARFPFLDSNFDSLVCNQVFEHVFNPNEFMGEIYRIMKPGGILLLTVPFVWDEHEQPYDFARYSSFGIRSILEKQGFTIIEHRKSVDDVRVIFQLFNAYIYKKTITKSGLLNMLLTMGLMAPFNILGELLSFITPRNTDLYLDNIVLAKKADITHA